MLSKEEIKKAAETVACNAWERGASAGGIEEEIRRVFSPDECGEALEAALAWLDRVDSSPFDD